MMQIPCLTGVFLLLVLVAAPVANSQRPGRLKVGDRFPKLTLPSLADGKPLSLAAFRGRKVLLIEFASW